VDPRRSGAGVYLGALTALVLLAGCGGESPAPEAMALESSAQALATTHPFKATVDGWVEEAVPSRNNGLASSLRADTSPRSELYVRFKVHGLKGTVTRVVLRLYATDGTSDGPQVFGVTDSWEEGELTWTNRPPRQSSPIADAGAISTGTWVEYDVTSAVQADGLVNLALVPTSSDGVVFSSREAARADLRPQLVVTLTPEPPAPTGCMLRTDTYYRSTINYVDGYVSQSEPTRNFVQEPRLLVDGSPWLESYFSFYIDDGGLAVRQAWMELQATDSTSNGPLLYRTRSQWSGESLTWNTRPERAESPVGNLGAISANTRVTYDLTGVVMEWGHFSFGLLPESSDGVAFSSRETPGENYPGPGPSLHYILESPAFCTYRGTGGGLTEWTRQYGGSGAEYVDAMAPHPEGGFVAVGRFGEATFPKQYEGLALARYSATGSPLWSRVVATERVHAYKVTLTSLGNILVAGTYHGAPDFGTGPLPFVPEDEPMQGMFIAKFSPGGQTAWARGFIARGPQGQVQGSFANEVSTDANGSVLVTGSFSGELNLGGGVLRSNALANTEYPHGGFVVKFSWDGQHVWSRAIQSGDEDPFAARIFGSGVAADAAGNVLVSGSASPWSNLGDGPLGQRAPFIAKYSPTGTLLWKRLFQGAYGEITKVRPQGTGRVAFMGNLGGPFTFAGQSYYGGNPDDGYKEPPNTNGFVGALTDAGGDVWLRSVGTGTGFSLSFRELAVGEDGALTLSGRGEEVFNLGGGPMGLALNYHPAFGTGRGFVVRYAPQGEHRWSRAFDLGREVQVALQPGGAVVLGTSLSGPFELEGTTRSPLGSSDLLYLRLKP